VEVGFIGLGTMGSRMAANLLKGGHSVWGYDLSGAAMERASGLGAVSCKSPREASQGRDVVLLSLTTPAAVEQAVLGEDGVLAASPVPPLLVDTTTSLPSLTRRIAAVATERGCQVLDAAVSGRPQGAESATLSIMVGGPAEAFDRLLPLLQLLGRDIFLVGEVGSGHAAKLVNNAITAATRVAIAEAFMMGVMAGVEPRALADVIAASTGSSRTLQGMVPHLLSGDYQADFPVDLMHKDVGLATQLGHELGVPMPLVNLTRETFQAARAAGLGKLDSSAVAVLLERLMGVEMRDRSGEA
jgi:3-hydroxyisobutyrate dehydrogenase-like beta-hydroxyacid dehydrogenase